MTNTTGRSDRWQVVVGLAAIISAIAAVMVVPEFRKAVLRSHPDRPVFVSSNTGIPQEPSLARPPAVGSKPADRDAADVQDRTTNFRVQSTQTRNGFSVTLESLATSGDRTEARLSIVNHNPTDHVFGLDCNANAFVVDYRGMAHEALECAIAGSSAERLPQDVFVPGVTYTASVWFRGAVANDSFIPVLRLICRSLPESEVSSERDAEEFRLQWRDLKPKAAP